MASFSRSLVAFLPIAVLHAACGSQVTGGGAGSGQGSGGGSAETTGSTGMGGASSSVGVGGAVASSVGAGGFAAQTGVGGSSVSVGPGGGGACGTPAPVGTLEFCGGSASASNGMGFQCTAMMCDDSGNTWDATCDDQGNCTCSYNSVPVCACQLPGTGCNGQGCCPAPWGAP